MSSCLLGRPDGWRRDGVKASDEMAMAVGQGISTGGGRIPWVQERPSAWNGCDGGATGSCQREELRERYLERIYTEHELKLCIGEPLVEAASLAARFAAKEATIKVLRPGGHHPIGDPSKSGGTPAAGAPSPDRANLRRWRIRRASASWPSASPMRVTGRAGRCRPVPLPR